MRRRSAGVDRRRGRFLDDLLVPALHRAVALAEMDRRCRARRRRPGSRRGARRRRARSSRRRASPNAACGFARWPTRAPRRARRRSRTRRMPRPPPPAAALTISGKPIRAASRCSRPRSCVRAVVARQHRHAGRGHASPRLGLVAHRPHRRGRRADPDQAGGGHRLGEGRVLATGSRSRDARRRRRDGAPRRDARRCAGTTRRRARRRSRPTWSAARVCGACAVGVRVRPRSMRSRAARAVRAIAQRRSRRGWRSGRERSIGGLSPAAGRVCMYLQMMPSITSSAPPPIEPSRPSR